MPEQITPARKPLFAKKKVETIKVEETQPSFMPEDRAEFKPTASKGSSLFENKKLWISVGIVAIAIVVIMVVVIAGLSYMDDASTKAGLLIPFIYKNYKNS